jgi:peptide deformylase
MALPIAQLGQPVLRQPAEPLPPDAIGSAEVQAFLQAMKATLAEAGGVGLAAPQVFVSRRIFLAQVALPPEDEEVPMPPPEVLINPRIVAIAGEPEAAWEGCLSFPELLVLVSRQPRVRVEYLDEAGQPKALDLEGFPARVVQHEHDHLEGILTLDRAASSRDIVKASEIEAVLRERGEEGMDPEPQGPGTA